MDSLGTLRIYKTRTKKTLKRRRKQLQGFGLFFIGKETDATT